MKNYFLLSLLFFSVLIFGQKKETIDFKFRLKDSKKSIKSLTVIDSRIDTIISNYNYKGTNYEFTFPTSNAKSDIEKWFNNDNPKRGNRDLYLVLNRINVTPFKDQEFNCAKIDVEAAMFEKINDNFQLIKIFDELRCPKNSESPNIGKSIASGIGMQLFKIITYSYDIKASNVFVSKENLASYNLVLKNKLIALSTETLKDGLYLNSSDFFNQNPTKAEIIRNARGNIVKFNANNETVRPENTFAYIENGNPFKYTYIGFLPMEKDKNGFYINARVSQIFTPHTQPANTIYAGAIGAIGDHILNKDYQKRLSNEEIKKIYINSLSGNYIF